MNLFRIDRDKRRNSVLSGKGAELFGGRWNAIGTPTIYCAESRALAMLEILVHTRSYADLPVDRIMVQLNIPKEIKIKKFTLEELPPNWTAPNSEPNVQLFMQSYIPKYCVIQVPSVVVPEENNYLLNPRHPKFAKIKLIKITNLNFDKRLF